MSVTLAPVIVVKDGEVRLIGMNLLADGRYLVVAQGHDSYVDPLDSGSKGYQAACWDCEWRGPEHLRGSEEMGTEASRFHKRQAKTEAAEHRQETAG